jgi:hypothetical protein
MIFLKKLLSSGDEEISATLESTETPLGSRKPTIRFCPEEAKNARIHIEYL